MSVRPIIDAGPGLNFLSINKERTLTVLERAAGTGHLPGRAAMRDTYQRLRGLDDGLPPIDQTRLLSPALWS